MTLFLFTYSDTLFGTLSRKPIFPFLQKALFAAITLVVISCQDFQDKIIYEYTEEQKQVIQEAANQYGIEIEFSISSPKEPLLTPIAVKHYLRSLASVMGKDFSFFLNDSNSYISLMEPPYFLKTKSAVEVGSWSDTLYGSYCGFKVTVNKNHQYVDASISLVNAHGATFTITEKDVFQGILSEIVNVDIEGTLYYSGMSIRTYFYGYVNLDSHQGSIAVWNDPPNY